MGQGEYQTVGRLERERRVGDLGFLVTEYEPPRRAARHSHDLASLTFVLDGAYHERTAGLPAEHVRGAVLYKPPAEPHSNRFVARATTLLVQFPGRTGEPEMLDLPLLDETFCLRTPGAESIGRRMLNALGADDACADLSLECLTFELLGLAAEGPGARHPVARGSVSALSRDWLHAHLAQRLDLRRIATEIGVTASHVARSFRRAYGCTLGSYQRRLRVAHAMRLLAGDDTPITGVAQAVGLVDQSHLNRLFRRHLGQTPGAYRRCVRSRSHPT